MVKIKMKVGVRYFGLFRTSLKKGEEEIEIETESSLKNLLNKLVETYGDPLKKLLSIRENILDPSVVVAINDVPIGQLKGVKTILSEGDRISLMILVSGG